MYAWQIENKKRMKKGFVKMCVTAVDIKIKKMVIINEWVLQKKGY